MKFSESALKIGEGLVTHAVHKSTGDEFLLRCDGAVYLVKKPLEKKVFSKLKLVSYAGECFFVKDKILERCGEELRYVS